jgi:uncharacterized protein (DUF2236 family)
MLQCDISGTLFNEPDLTLARSQTYGQPMSTILEPARDWLAAQIRSRVVGDQPTEKAAAIFDAPGPRWFSDDSPVRIVHRDASMFVGGLRALLLQSLHPLAMAGVAEHSDYRQDPWGRLQRTADFLATTTFGPAELAERAVSTVTRVHTHVVGTAPDGRPYAANDPHLLLWVHVVEVDSFLRANQRFGDQRLNAAQADAYVRDYALIAEKLGAEQPPKSVTELSQTIKAFRSELRGTHAARQAARFLVLEPPLPLAARGPYLMLAAAAVSLLPMWARLPLRLPYLPMSEALVVRPGGEAVTRLIRWSLPSPTVG